MVLEFCVAHRIPFVTSDGADGDVFPALASRQMTLQLHLNVAFATQLPPTLAWLTSKDYP